MSQTLIEALQNPALYDHPVEQFKVVQTHISWVILTGEYAYKVKKPMDFGFLNFSTLDARKHFCEQELKLNQRLAPQLYLEVLPITGSPDAPQINGNGSGEAFEYAIKMVQFDETQLLDQLLQRGELSVEHIDQLADQLAAFHDSIPSCPDDVPFGTPANVNAPVEQNFEQIKPFLEHKNDLAQLKQLHDWAEDTFSRLEQRFSERKQQGRIRECHGDIHLGNVTCFDGKVTLFDCIEFNDDFRLIDVMSDLAFILMDLEDRDQKALSNRLLNRYLEHTGDFHGLSVLNFYKAYRAVVRGKIALFSIPPDATSKQREQGFARYRKYADLAESYMALHQRYIMIMHGVSGSGKTTISQRLVDNFSPIRLRTDVERKRLAGLTAEDRSESALNKGLYTPAMNEKTYQHMAELCAFIVEQGYPVLADGTHLKQEQRDCYTAVAEAHGVPHGIISCKANPEQMRAWIEQREAAGTDASEAGIAVFEQQLENQEPITEAEKECYIEVKTDLPGAIDELLRRLHGCLTKY